MLQKRGLAHVRSQLSKSRFSFPLKAVCAIWTVVLNATPPNNRRGNSGERRIDKLSREARESKYKGGMNVEVSAGGDLSFSGSAELRGKTREIKLRDLW